MIGGFERVDDLVDAFLLAQHSMATESGNAFNIGGGPGNTVSLLELLEMIGMGGRIPVVRSGATSCSSAGCHGPSHAVKPEKT
mgnify:CR=1 FL=1